MSRLQKKPFFSIEIPSDENQLSDFPQNDNQEPISSFRLTRINSTKNAHEMKKFAFPFATKVSCDRAVRQEKIRKLQKQKQQLIESLQILKNGAVNCIIEKDETIAKLRSILTQETPASKQTRVQEVDKLLQYIRDLEDQRKYLREELLIKKGEYQRELYEKDELIAQLNHELDWSVTRIQRLEKYDELLEQKIKIMEADNQNLSILLNQSQESLKDQTLQLSKSEILKTKDPENTFNNSSQISQIQGNTSIISVDNNPSSYSLINHIDQQLVQCKIKQLKQQHQLEISDLTNFYESRIESLKQICDKSFQYIPLLNIPCSPKNIQRISENYSIYSGQSNSEPRQKQHTLKKKFSFSSFRSQNFMEPIDEREELPSPRKSLKDDTPLQFDSYKASRKHLYSESDGRSVMSIRSAIQNNKSEKSFQIYEVPSKDDPDSKIFKKKKENKKVQKWEKVLWFTLGSLAGGSLLKFGQKIFK